MSMNAADIWSSIKALNLNTNGGATIALNQFTLNTGLYYVKSIICSGDVKTA